VHKAVIYISRANDKIRIDGYPLNKNYQRKNAMQPCMFANACLPKPSGVILSAMAGGAVLLIVARPYPGKD
jgi:hypothetical protein